MKAKRLACILAVFGIGAGAFGLGGCNIGESANNKNEQIYSVYQSYVAYAESNGQTAKTYEEWLAEIKGEDGKDGADGKSAYEIWLEAGNAGTEEDFIADLKGEKGEQGEKGDAGSHVAGARQVFTDKWKIGYYFEFTLSDGSSITTDTVITVDTDKVYVADTEEELDILLGYGVAPEKIKYEYFETEPDEPVELTFPLAKIELNKQFDFSYETSTNRWHFHDGWDLKAEEGEEVFVALDGTVESLVIDDKLGSAVTIAHANGLKTVYRYIDVCENLNAGDTVAVSYTDLRAHESEANRVFRVAR